MTSNTAATIREQLTTHIGHKTRQHPRTLQTAVGPSEIGACPRRILHRLAGTPRDPNRDTWRADVGTAIHQQLEQWFQHTDGYLTELRLHIADDLRGTCDLYHIPTRTVIDWKTISTTKLKAVKTSGNISNQYRVQAHLYGLGISRLLDTPPHTVAIAFVPRDGLLSDMHIWDEPWRQEIADDAIGRYRKLKQQLTEQGLEDALKLHPPCGEWYCKACQPAAPKTLAEAYAQANQ